MLTARVCEHCEAKTYSLNAIAGFRSNGQVVRLFGSIQPTSCEAQMEAFRPLHLDMGSRTEPVRGLLACTCVSGIA